MQFLPFKLSLLISALKGYIHFFTEGTVDAVDVDEALIGCEVQIEDIIFDAGAEAAPA